MATRAAIKANFETGDKPTQAQFSEWIDSDFNLDEDTTDDITEGTTNLFTTQAEKDKLSTLNAILVADKTARNAYPLTDRTRGLIFTYLDTEMVTVRYQLADVTDVNWQNDVNWSGIGGGTAEYFTIACSDETTDLASVINVVEFQMPFAMTLSGVRATVNTAPVGSTIIVDINVNGTSILSTKLSIDVNEKTSVTADTVAVISNTSLSDSGVITIDIDQVGSSTAGTGLKVQLIGNR